MQNVWIIPLQHKRNAESPNDSEFILVSKFVLSVLHPIFYIPFDKYDRNYAWHHLSLV